MCVFSCSVVLASTSKLCSSRSRLVCARSCYTNMHQYSVCTTHFLCVCVYSFRICFRCPLDVVLQNTILKKVTLDKLWRFLVRWNFSSFLRVVFLLCLFTYREGSVDSDDADFVFARQTIRIFFFLFFVSCELFPTGSQLSARASWGNELGLFNRETQRRHPRMAADGCLKLTCPTHTYSVRNWVH